jgi:hypothetical protein
MGFSSVPESMTILSDNLSVSSSNFTGNSTLKGISIRVYGSNFENGAHIQVIGGSKGE